MSTDVVSLAKHAAEVSQAIFSAHRGHIKPSDDGYLIAHDVAVRLHLINTYLSSLPPYWIESDVEKLCHKLLGEISDIATVRTLLWAGW